MPRLSFIFTITKFSSSGSRLVNFGLANAPCEVLNSYNVFFFEPSMFIPHKAYAESDLADELVGSVVKIILSFDTHLTAPTLLFPLPEVKTVVEPLLVLYKINLPPL